MNSNQDIMNAAIRFETGLTKHGIELISFNKRVFPDYRRSVRMINAIGRAAMPMIHVPNVSTFYKGTRMDQGDLNATPMGIRMIYSQYRDGRVIDWYDKYIRKYFPEKLYPVILQPYILSDDPNIDGDAKARLLMPRGFHPVYNTTIKIPYYHGKHSLQEWTGIIDHVCTYSQPLTETPSDWLSEFEDLASEVISDLPIPSVPWRDALSSGEWFYNIRTDSNSGWPYYLKQSREVDESFNPKKGGMPLRQLLYDTFSEDVMHAKFKDWYDKVVYTLFYRTQWLKDRGVMGARAKDKVFGAALNYVLLKTWNVENTGIAWGTFEQIRDIIFEGMRKNQSGSMISVDYSGLDSTFTFDYIKIILKLLIENWSIADPMYEEIFKYADHCMTDGAYLAVSPRKCFKVNNGMLSGTPLTQALDSIFVKILDKKLDKIVGSQSTSLYLGDDVIKIGVPEMKESFEEWVEWTKIGGLKVSISKSYPSTVENGFGIFLQYVYYWDNGPTVIGNIGRRICSLALRERDSSLLKAVDVQQYMKENKVEFKLLWLLRSLQILASLVLDNFPREAIDEILHFVRRYDKHFSNHELLEKAVSVGDRYYSEKEYWKVTGIHPNSVLKYILGPGMVDSSEEISREVYKAGYVRETNATPRE
jgi:hypothetical protein